MRKMAVHILLVFLIITGLWCLLIYNNAFSWFDYKVLDYFQKTVPPIPQDTNIVVITYDDKTSENITGSATDLDIAALIHIIEEQKPRVLAVDIFSMFDILRRSDSSGFLQETFRQYDNICYGVGFLVPSDHEVNGKEVNDKEFDYLSSHLYPLFPGTLAFQPYRAAHLFKPVNEYYRESRSLGHLVLKNDADGVFRRIPACDPVQ